MSLILLCILAVVMLALSWGNPRFRLPAEPALAVAAAFILVGVERRRAMLPG